MSKFEQQQYSLDEALSDIAFEDDYEEYSDDDYCIPFPKVSSKQVNRRVPVLKVTERQPPSQVTSTTIITQRKDNKSHKPAAPPLFPPPSHVLLQKNSDSDCCCKGNGISCKTKSLCENSTNLCCWHADVRENKNVFYIDGYGELDLTRYGLAVPQDIHYCPSCKISDFRFNCTNLAWCKLIRQLEQEKIVQEFALKKKLLAKSRRKKH